MVEITSPILSSIPGPFPYEKGLEGLPELSEAPRIIDIDGPKFPWKPISPHVHAEGALRGLPDYDSYFNPVEADVTALPDDYRATFEGYAAAKREDAAVLEQMPGVQPNEVYGSLLDPVNTELSPEIDDQTIFSAVWPLFVYPKRQARTERLMAQFMKAETVAELVRKFYPTWQELNARFMQVYKRKRLDPDVLGTLSKWQERLQQVLPAIYPPNPLRG